MRQLFQFRFFSFERTRSFFPRYMYQILLERELNRQIWQTFQRWNISPDITKMNAIYFYILIRTISYRFGKRSRRVAHFIEKNRGVQNSRCKLQPRGISECVCRCEEWIENQDIAPTLRRTTRSYVGRLRHGRLCAANCQVSSRTTNNRKCSYNNADIRRCSRMRSRTFAYRLHNTRICVHTRAHTHERDTNFLDYNAKCELRS